MADEPKTNQRLVMLKGGLYVTISAVPVLITALATWSKDPPANGYVVAALGFSFVLAAATALKAFLSDSTIK